jgi:hypothetical protein
MKKLNNQFFLFWLSFLKLTTENGVNTLEKMKILGWQKSVICILESIMTSNHFFYFLDFLEG